MPTFSDFTTIYPDKRYKNNAGANALFNHLCNPKVIGNMIHKTEQGCSAVCGIPDSLSRRFYFDPNFPLSDNKNHSYVGKMVCYIMNLYGYSLDKERKNAKKNKVPDGFSSGYVYKKI